MAKAKAKSKFVYEYKIESFTNYDGDSFRLKLNLGFYILFKKQCRILGIDTPELRNRDKVSKRAGYLARDVSRAWVKDAIKDGGAMFVSEGIEGKFGRPLGNITRIRDGETMRDMLVADNLAVAYHGQNKADVAEAHAKNLAILVAQGRV